MQTQEVIEGWRGVCVAVGLGAPVPRGVCAAVVAGIAAYAAGYPRKAFRSDGSLRPYYRLSPSPDATDFHFLMTPVAVGAAVYLLT